MQYAPASSMRMPGQVPSSGYAMPTTSAYPGAAPRGMPSYGGQRVSAPTMAPGVQVVGGAMPQVMSGGPQVMMGGGAMGGPQVMMGGGPMGGMGMPMAMGPMGPMGPMGMGMGGDMIAVMEVCPMAMMMGPGGEMVIMEDMGGMMGGMGPMMGGMAIGGPMGGGPMGEIMISPGGGAIMAAPQFRAPQPISLDDLPFSSIGHKAMWQGIFDMVQREVDAFLKTQKNAPQAAQFRAPRIPMPNIPDQQIEMIFDSYDMQKTGFLDRDRIKALMRDMQCVTCVAMSNQKGEALQEARQELTMMLGPQMATMMSGAVSQMMDFELQMVKQISMQDVSDEECNELVRDLDADKDGRISKRDFLMNAKKALFDPNPPEEIMQAMEAMEAAFNGMSLGGGGGPMMIMDGNLPVQAAPMGMGGATVLGGQYINAPPGAMPAGLGGATFLSSQAVGASPSGIRTVSSTLPSTMTAQAPGSRVIRVGERDLGAPTVVGSSLSRPPSRIATPAGPQQFMRAPTSASSSGFGASASFAKPSPSIPQRQMSPDASVGGPMKAKVIGGGISGTGMSASSVPPARTTVQRAPGGVSVGTAPGGMPARVVYR